LNSLPAGGERFTLQGLKPRFLLGFDVAAEAATHKA
jgi:hypothetical protein